MTDDHHTDDNLDLSLARVATAVTTVANDALTPLGIGLKQHSVLRLLAAEGPRSQQALSRALGIDRSSMVLVIDDLERGGLVARRRDPADRRAYLVELKPRGARTLEQSAERTQAAIRHALAPLDAAERRQLRDLLARVARDLPA